MPTDAEPPKLARARPARRDDADDVAPQRRPHANLARLVWLAATASVLCLFVAGAAVYTAVTATRQALAAKQQAAEAEQRAAVARPALVVATPAPKPAALPRKAKPSATAPVPSPEPPDDEPTPADRPGRLDAEPSPPANQGSRGQSPAAPLPKPKTPTDRLPTENPPATGFAKPPQADGPSKAVVDEAARQLRKGPTPQRRIEGAHKLREFGPAAAAAATALCDALMDPSPAVAAAALQAIEQVRSDLYQPLTTLAVDGNGGNHVAAVRQLGLMGHEAGCCAGLLLNRLRAELSRGPRHDYPHAGELTVMQRALFDAIPQINPEDTGTVTYYKAIAAPTAQFDAAKWQALNALFLWSGSDEARRKQVLPFAVAALRNAHCQGLGIHIVGEYGTLAREVAPLLRQLKLAGDAKVRESAAKALERVEGR